MRRTPLDAWIGKKIGAGDVWAPADLKAWQLCKLNETLALARAHSRFYRHHLAGLPEQLIKLDQLAEFPFTTPEDIRKNPLQFVCVSQDEIARVVTLQTSGTTGDPKRLYFTKNDQELTIDFFGVGMSTLVNEGEKVMICLPGHTPGSVGDLLRVGLEGIGAVPLPFGSVDDLQRVFQFIHDYKPVCYVGSPLQMLGLARRWPIDLTPPRSILLSTDYLTNAAAQTLKQIWQCAIFDHYGTTEMGLGGGVECEVHQGLHMREADMLFEIIDPQSGAVLPPGEAGEVVFTTLTRSGMPLIRYRMGDKSRMLFGKCPCGSHVLRLESPQGRYINEWQVYKKRLNLKELDECFLCIPGVLDVKYSLSGDKLSATIVLAGETDVAEFGKAIKAAESLVGSKIQVESVVQPEYMVSLSKRRFE